MTKQITPKGRVSFPAVFQPQAPDKERPNDKKYSLTLLFPKDDPDALKQLRAEIEQTIANKYGKDVPRKLKTPIKDGDEEDRAEFHGHWFIRMASNADRKAPDVVDAEGQAIREEDNAFYPGCYARASYRLYAWSHPTGGEGISIGLNNVQKLEDGERLDGGSSAADDFGTPTGDFADDEVMF